MQNQSEYMLLKKCFLNALLWGNLSRGLIVIRLMRQNEPRSHLNLRKGEEQLRTLKADSEIKEKYNLVVPNKSSALNSMQVVYNEREQMKALITQTADKLFIGIAKCKEKINI